MSCRCVCPLCSAVGLLSVCLSCPFQAIRTFVVGFRACPKSRMTYLNHIFKNVFQLRPLYRYQGLGAGHGVGDTVPPTTGQALGVMDAGHDISLPLSAPSSLFVTEEAKDRVKWATLFPVPGREGLECVRFRLPPPPPALWYRLGLSSHHPQSGRPVPTFQ